MLEFVSTWSLYMASGCTHNLFCWSFAPAGLTWRAYEFMFNKHFIKRLFFFVLIIACGAILTLVVNYIQNSEKSPAQTEAFDS